ncbi:hypothetical protein GYMLUDRAFT_173678 [Collybiopsis luxurians FD-317 M1]|uniref:Uncharacterized protein n=1 Tax=Collybiopsis luxurians FD-317 M1 TaxID=944289 RepID=A0A0D0BP71_9AGAR|nr:hypothetical protein GYMLUDRAFT_173678 [Collybiopsis luxurians FD-317 M1]
MSLNSIIGILEVANGLSTFFLGITTLQSYFFYRAFPQEKWQVKLVVSFDSSKCLKVSLTIQPQSAFELGHTISLSHTLYEMTIIDFGQPQRFTKLPNSIEVTILLEGMITIAVQGFFISRVYRLPRIPKIISYFLFFLAVLRFAASFPLTIGAFKVTTYNEFLEHWSWLLTTLFSLGSFVDLGVSCTLCVFLVTQRNTSFKR